MKRQKIPFTAAWTVLFVASLLALIAALVLSVEKIHLLQDPNAVLSCSVNLVLNCSTVMESWQASVFFGIPNSFIGLMAFPVLIAVAVSALWGGAQFKRWFLLAMNVCITAGTVFAYWLFFNSLYVIEVLCPWCLVVTATCTLMMAASTHITLKSNLLRFSSDFNKRIQGVLEKGYHQLLVASWIVVVIALIFLKFGTDIFA